VPLSGAWGVVTQAHDVGHTVLPVRDSAPYVGFPLWGAYKLEVS
jgi:hypothetical protein